jgi:hypothetical protein
MMTATLMMVASPAWAGTFTVDRGDDPIPVGGASACTASPNDCSLRGAIERSYNTATLDTIQFDPTVRGTITLGDALTTGDPNDPIANDLTINGPGRNALTVKQSAQVRVFQIVGKTTIKGITISGGRSPNNAGGILNGGNLTLNDTTVTDNQALGTQAGTGLGGGIYNASNATLTLNRSTVSGNEANTFSSDGGGIYNSGGTVALNNSTVSDNQSVDKGGGIYNLFATLTLNNSTLRGNQATFGGGIYSNTDPDGPTKTTVTNSTISGNTASSQGGGIYNTYGLTAIKYSTITNNSAPTFGDGSGVASYDDTATTRTEVLSSIVSANTNTDVDFVSGTGTNSFVSKGFNRIGDGNATAAFNKPGDQSLVMVPGLGPLANNGGPTQTHALLAGSPAIDRGTNTGCPATDQRGVPRPQGRTCDIGAFERDRIPPKVITTSPTGAKTGVARSTNLSATFSEKMDRTTLTKSTFKLYRVSSNGTTTQVTNVVVGSTTDGLKAVLNPFGTSTTLLAANTRYRAVVTPGAKDLAGNALDQNPSATGSQSMVWTFTTGTS